ncbi:MAG: TolC family protein [Cytophagales bacterium]|nr:TolC family protein [Cytophagales bacterium]
MKNKNVPQQSTLRPWRFWVGILFSILLMQMPAQSQVVSLDSMLSVIDRQNPMLQSYRSSVTALHNYTAGSKAQMAPEVGGGLWMFPYRKQEVGHLQDPRQVMVSVTQTFTNPAKLKARYNYLHSKAAIEQAGERIAYNELRAQAKAAYYTLAILHQKQEVFKQAKATLNLMLTTTQARYSYNQARLNTIYKTEAVLYELANMALMVESEEHHAHTTLLQLMNLPPHTLLKVDTVLPGAFVASKTDTLLLAAQRSDVKRMDRTIQAMRYNQALEKAQRKPDFNLNFSHMFSVGAGMPNQFMLLGMVTIPIAPWSAKMYKANVQAMNYEIESMKQERVAMLNEAQAMAANMLAELRTLKQQLENYEIRILPTLKKNYEVLLLAYSENREDLPMVLDGWDAYTMTHLQYLDTKIKYYIYVSDAPNCSFG